MSTIFISHSSADNAVAKKVESKLEAKGHHSVFLDLDPEKGIPAGQSWERTLYHELRACRAMVAVCTDHYLASHWCFAEVALARMEGKPIFTLLVEPRSETRKMPSILTDTQYIDLRTKEDEDLRTKEDEGFERLWRGLEEARIPPALKGAWESWEAPYLGLHHFEKKHAPIFFGREEETDRALDLLRSGRRQNLILVLGASGSGKSSLVRAGMLPRLEVDPGWLVVGPMRPEDDPLRWLAVELEVAFRREADGRIAAERAAAERREALPSWRELLARLTEAARAEPADGAALNELALELAKAFERAAAERAAAEPRRPPPSWPELLEKLKAAGGAALRELARDLRADASRPDARVLLVIDQFEELLGHAAPEDSRGSLADFFLRILRACLDAKGSRLVVLATMRSDYLAAFQQHPELRGLAFSDFPLGQMAPENLRQVIEEPARKAEPELKLEKGLVKRLLEDTGTPDALPLLAFTLRSMWDRYGKEDRRLEIAEYEDLEGLAGAVAREADAALEEALAKAKEEDLRAAFLDMARLAEDGGYARRPVSWDELKRKFPAAQEMLDPFEKKRLLVFGDGTVEVAHEALFRSWEKLKGWLEEYREALLLRDQLRRAAKLWKPLRGDAHEREYLWTGERLERARELETLLALESDAGDFLDASRKAEEKDREKKEKDREEKEERQRRLRQALVRADLDQARHLIDGDRRRKALAHLARALRLDGGNSVARGAAFDLLLRVGSPIPGEPLRHDDWVLSASFSPDGRRVVTTSRDGSARLWDAATGEPVGRPLRHDDWVLSASFSPDGRRVVTTSRDHAARLWNAATGEPIGEPMPHDSDWPASFSLDGRRMVTCSEGMLQVRDAATAEPVGKPRRGRRLATSPGTLRSVTRSEGNTLQVWDEATGEPVGQPLRHEGEVPSAWFSPDGQRLVTASRDHAKLLWDHTMLVWDIATGKPIGEPLQHKLSASSMDKMLSPSFSPDGRRLVTRSWYSSQVWDAATGKPVGEPFELSGAHYCALFSPDGLLVATIGGPVRLWKAATGEPVGDPLRYGVNNTSDSAAFSADGQRLVTVCQEHAARVWDVSPGEPVGNPLWHEGAVTSASFSPDGQRIVTVSTGHTARVWDAATGEPVGEPLRHQARIESASFSPDGQRLLTAPEENAAQVWDAATGAPVGNPLSCEEKVTSAWFSPNGPRIVTASGDHMVWVRGAATGEPVGEPLCHGTRVLSASFSPDGQRLVTVSAAKKARVWDASTGKPVGEPLRHEEPVHSASFSPDGQRVVTEGNRTARLWDAATGAPVGEPMRHRTTVRSASFSPDNARVVTGSNDETARLWDAATGAPVGEPMRHGGEARSASFSPDGQRVVTASDDGTARVWDAATGRPVGEPLRHGSDVTSASFSPDGRRLVTATRGGEARVWDVLIGSPDDAKELAELAEVVGGRLTELGNFEAIPLPKRSARLAELRRLGAAAEDHQPTAASFVRWYFTPRFERTVSPLSKMTVETYLRQLLERGTETARREAERAFPGHPLLSESPAPPDP